MATKINLMKMLQEMRGFSEIAQRYPSPKSPALYAIQLRSHLYETRRPKRKLIVAIDLAPTPDIPDAVKITHLSPPASPAPGV